MSKISGILLSATALLALAGPAFAEHIKVDMPSKPDDPYSEKVEMPLKAVREQLFARKLMTETKVIIFCLRAQFEDFLEPMRRLAATTVSLRAKAASSSDSQKESIGSSTASPPVTDTETA